MPDAAIIAGHESVHVHRGRLQHLAATGYKTLCGQWFVATNIGPPATDKPVCGRCVALVGGDEEVRDGTD